MGGGRGWVYSRGVGGDSGKYYIYVIVQTISLKPDFHPNNKSKIYTFLSKNPKKNTFLSKNPKIYTFLSKNLKYTTFQPNKLQLDIFV